MSTVTQEQNNYNLRTVKRKVAQSLGISNTANIADFEQRKNYVQTLAAEILKYPNAFNAVTLAAASDISGKEYGSLTDTDISFGDFVDAFADEAKTLLPDVGNKILLAVLILGAVYIFVNRKPVAA